MKACKKRQNLTYHKWAIKNQTSLILNAWSAIGETTRQTDVDSYKHQ